MYAIRMSLLFRVQYDLTQLKQKVISEIAHMPSFMDCAGEVQKGLPVARDYTEKTEVFFFYFFSPCFCSFLFF